jgi:hypothetical protein
VVEVPRELAFGMGGIGHGRNKLTIKRMTCSRIKLACWRQQREIGLMLGKALIALAAALWLCVPQAASAGYHCYGDGAVVGSSRCAGVGLGVHSPRWYYSDHYPYWMYFHPEPYVAFRDVVGGCYLIRRPVLTADGWRPRTVQVCD